MVPGLEGLAVDDAGRLWSLSESGTRKYLSWDTKFPYIFQINIDSSGSAPAPSLDFRWG